MNNAEGFKVEADLKLAWNGIKIIDPVSFRVLQALSASTCIQDAVKLSGVPYRTAWEHIRNAGKALGQDLIKSRSGGVQGGGTALTPAGHSILSLFQETNREHAASLSSINQRLEQEWNRPLRHLGGFPC
jgi:molybdate transport system regulatory protein